MASIQRIVSPITKSVSYRAQVRVKGRPAQSETFPNRKEAQSWAASIEAAIREGRHFPHAAARRTSFDALAKDYTETVLAEFDEKERATRMRQLNWWAEQFAGLALAEITPVYNSPGGELLIHEPSFLAWFLGLGGRARPRAGRRRGRQLNGSIAVGDECPGPC